MEENGRCYGHSVNFQTIWYIQFLFGIFCYHLVHFPRFGILHYEKSGNPETIHKKALACCIHSPNSGAQTDKLIDWRQGCHQRKKTTTSKKQYFRATVMRCIVFARVSSRVTRLGDFSPIG
jgi:hypothetical protein